MYRMSNLLLPTKIHNLDNERANCQVFETDRNEKRKESTQIEYFQTVRNEMN